MKKILLLLAVALCAVQLQAADVDLATAQSMAQSFMRKQVAEGRLKAAAASNLKLVKAEASVAKPQAVDYYIFNGNKSYVVVAGDDQVPEILMYGEEGVIDMNNIPPAMQWLLNKYKYQIDGIKAGTLKANNFVPKTVTAVEPLVKANWDQSAPYNNQCPTSGSSHAVTGCPATSLAMCYYKWKWPRTFPACAAIDGSSSGGLSAPALPEREADWDNIIDEYTGPTNYTSTAAQKDAVAWLMRYAGQSIPDFMYGTDASGANDPEIYQGVLNMGYTDAEYLLLTELVGSWGSYSNGPQQYTDAEWNNFMMTELLAGRPIEYLAYDYSGWSLSGHAFNVFGCDSSGKYYVNWGWSGDSNGYCSLHNFTTATGATGQAGSYVFNYGEAMIIGIEPPAGALGPSIKVEPTSLTFDDCYVGETYTKTFTVKGYNLTEDVTISMQGASCYTVSPTTFTAESAASGVEVTVTYSPTATGNTNAVISIASAEAETVTMDVTGIAEPRVPTIKVDQASLNFRAKLGSAVTKTVNVTGLFLTNDVTVALTDNNGVFSVSTTTITAANAANGVPVTVTFFSENEGDFTGTLTLTSNDAVTKTVQLTANANDGGTAADAYLDIANYASIDEVGNNVTGMSTIYKYTENEAEECAWLTVSNYGANVDDSHQNWFSVEETKNEAKSWTATDVFLGSTSYFGNNTSYCANWTEAYQHFYVTNCTQVKQYAYNRSSSYPLKIYIYECTVNDDGSITASTTPVQTLQSSVYSNNEVVASNALDENKVYKISVYNDYSYLYEIGFKTIVESVKAPVAIAATEIADTKFTANWMASAGAQSYTLRVMPKPAYTLLMTEGFSKCTTNGSTDIGNTLDNYMDNEGWTGSKLYATVGGIRLGTASAKGNLTSPALDLTNGGGKVSVKFNAKAFNNDTDCNFTISCGDAQQTVTIPSNTEAEYAVVLDCSAAAGQKVAFATTANSKRVVLTNIELYAGDITASTTMKGENEMLFTGITENNYTVTGLLPETEYIYDVKAISGDKQSRWSNVISVTTLAQQTLEGDVNLNGSVDIDDVNIIIAIILGKDQAENYDGRANINGDDNIDVDDVDAIIRIILGK